MSLNLKTVGYNRFEGTGGSHVHTIWRSNFNGYGYEEWTYTVSRAEDRAKSRIVGYYPSLFEAMEQTGQHTTLNGY